MKLNLIEIYFWFKEDGMGVISDWRNLICDDDTKLNYINHYDLKLFFACSRVASSLNNYISLYEVKRDKDYCKMVVKQLEELFDIYSKDTYFVDFKNKDVRNCINGLEHQRVLNILQDYMRYGIIHKLIEVSESSL